MQKPEIQILGKSDMDDGWHRDQGVSEMKYTDQYLRRWAEVPRVSAPAGPCILVHGETVACSGVFLI